MLPQHHTPDNRSLSEEPVAAGGDTTGHHFFRRTFGESADRHRCSLACCAHQTPGNIQLAGGAESPRGGEGLTGQAPKCLVAEIDTVWVMGVALECRVSALHRQASNIHTHREERTAMWLDQRPLLAVFPIKKEHKVRVHLFRDRKSNLAIRGCARYRRMLAWTGVGYQDIRIVMGPEPFYGHIGQRRIPPDKDALLGVWQAGVGTACDGKSDSRGGRLGRASLQKEHEAEKSTQCDG